MKQVKNTSDLLFSRQAKQSSKTIGMTQNVRETTTSYTSSYSVDLSPSKSNGRQDSKKQRW